jgi:hypothetical protein
MTALRRNVLGLLAIVWINMAVLPCAMAFQVEDDCPHCPPAEQHEMAAHQGHGKATAKPPCATSQPDCCDVVAASIDTRGGQLEFKPASELALVTTPAVANVPARAARHVGPRSDPPDICGSSPPLHVLFCIYLK